MAGKNCERVVTLTRNVKVTKEELLELSERDRALRKVDWLWKNASGGFFDAGPLRLELRGLKGHSGFLEAFVAAKVIATGRPVALGADRVRTERIIIPNPPVKISDGLGGFTFDPEAALRSVLAQTIPIIRKVGEPVNEDSIGRTTLVVYPAAGSGGATCDGQVSRDPASETFATIRAGAGTTADNISAQVICGLNASTTSNQFTLNQRIMLVFDTSPIGASGVISSATLSPYSGTSKTNGLGSPDFHVVSASPASPGTLVAADYAIANFGSTSFASISYASYTINTYNDMALNASGISNVSKTGVSKFGFIHSWDLNNSFTGTWVNSEVSRVLMKNADQAGTTEDPKLTVEYSLPSSGQQNSLIAGGVIDL